MSKEVSPGRFQHEIILAPAPILPVNLWIGSRRAVSQNPDMFTLFIKEDNNAFPFGTTPVFCAKHIAELRGHLNGATIDRQEFQQILKLSSEWVSSLAQQSEQ